MAIPASTAPLSPPLSPPTAAAEARDGFAPAEATPLHRSAVALRVEAAGPASTGAAAFFDERAGLLLAAVAGLDAFGAAELLTTAWLPVRVTPAVEPLVRAGAEFRVADEDGVRVADGVRCAWAVERCGRTALLRCATAPLVVADDERAGTGAAAGVCAGDAAAGAAAGAGAATAAAGAALGAAGAGEADGAVAGAAVEAGGAVGAAGVPYPDGVHAIATPTSTTGTLTSPVRAAAAVRVRRTMLTASS